MKSRKRSFPAVVFLKRLKKLENSAFPLFQSLANGDEAMLPNIEPKTVIIFLQRLNFSLEGAERLVYAKTG